MADRVTIVAPDDLVLINGIARPVDCAALIADGTRVVQWDGASGHVEFFNTPQDPVRPNEQIDSIAPYQSYIDAWNAWVPPPFTPPVIDPETDPAVQANRANERLDAGIEAASSVEVPTTQKGKPPVPPANGWPPTVPADVQQSLDYIMGQLNIVFEQLAILADSHTAMIEAQKTE